MEDGDAVLASTHANEEFDVSGHVDNRGALKSKLKTLLSDVVGLEQICDASTSRAAWAMQ